MLESNEAAAMLGMTLGALEADAGDHSTLEADTNAAIAQLMARRDGDDASRLEELAKKGQEDYGKAELAAAGGHQPAADDAEAQARIQAANDEATLIAKAAAAAAAIAVSALADASAHHHPPPILHEQHIPVASGSGSGAHDVDHSHMMDIDVNGSLPGGLVLDPYLDEQQHAYHDEDEDEEDGAAKPTKRKGRGKGWRRGTGKAPPKAKPVGPRRVSTKPRPPIKKMERYECRGTLIINLMHDDVLAFFVISHHMHHPEYVDVVGNRIRGARVPPPPVNLTVALTDPIGDHAFPGATGFDRAESALKSMLETVRELRAKSERDPGGGEEDAAEAMYTKTEDARKHRVAIVEALAKGRTPGLIKKEKKDRKPALSRKRKLDDVDGSDGAHRGTTPMDNVHLSSLVEQYLGRGTTAVDPTVAAWSLDPNLQAIDPNLQAADLMVMPEAGPSGE